METQSYTFVVEDDYWDLRHTDEEEFKKSLHKDILGREEELEPFLARYCNGLREEYSPGMLDCMWDDGLTLKADDTGDAILEFNGYAHHGCRDASGPVEHQETVAFKLDRAKRTVTLTFSYLPEREPDAY